MWRICRRSCRRRWGLELRGPFTAFWQHPSLLVELTRREIIGRYRGATLGLFWSLITPFLMLCIYTVVFGVMMNNRWPGMNGGRGEFALVLFVALIVHGFLAECLTRAPGLILSQPNFVKRVVFPLDVLPWAMVGSALFHSLANIVVLVLMQWTVGANVHASVLWLPVVLLPLALMMAGVGWLLASLGVYFRDIGQITGVLATAMLFLSSAFVPLESLSGVYKALILANPLTLFIEQARDVAIHGRNLDVFAWAGQLLAGICVALLGHAWFERTRGGFADVL